MSLSSNSLINQSLTNPKTGPPPPPPTPPLDTNWNFPNSLFGTIPITQFGDWNYTNTGSPAYQRFNYIIRASSTRHNTIFSMNKSFDKNTSTSFLSSNAGYPTNYGLPSMLQGANYTSSPYVTAIGVYQGGGHASRYWSTGGHDGEFLHIQLQFKLKLTSFFILPINTAENYLFPKDIVVLGSQDGTNWTLISEHTITNVLFPDGVTVNVSTNKRFSYLRWVYKSLNGGHLIKISGFEFTGDTYDIIESEED